MGCRNSENSATPVYYAVPAVSLEQTGICIRAASHPTPAPIRRMDQALDARGRFDSIELTRLGALFDPASIAIDMQRNLRIKQ